MALRLQGVIPACVTPFTQSGDVDHSSLASYVRWLAGVPGITAIVCNAHAGEGLSLTQDEKTEVIKTVVRATGDSLPVIAAVGGEGSRLVADEARAATRAGASGLLVFPSHVWLRHGYQAGAPEDRYVAVSKAADLPLVLFLYPAITRATFPIDTILRIASMKNVVAIKNGVRDMSRWDSELPVIRRAIPEMQVLTCHDEYLLHTMWEADGALVGYAGAAPEIVIDLFHAARSNDYARASAVYDRMLPLTQALYHHEPAVQATAALKAALVARGVLPRATVRSPLMPLAPKRVKEISAALVTAGLLAQVPEPTSRAARSSRTAPTTPASSE